MSFVRNLIDDAAHASDESALRTATHRTARLGEGLVDAHDGGVEPGHIAVPWSREFHVAALREYRSAYSPLVVQWLAELSARAVAVMACRPCPVGVAGSWTILQSHLLMAASVLADPEQKPPPMEMASGEAPLDHLPIDRLAGLVAEEGARTFAAAAAEVERVVEAEGVSSIENSDLEVLRGLAAGNRVLDVAINNGYSERSIYRRVGRICRLLGVNTKAEAIAVAAKNQWL